MRRVADPPEQATRSLRPEQPSTEQKEEQTVDADAWLGLHVGSKSSLLRCSCKPKLQDEENEQLSSFRTGVAHTHPANAAPQS